MIFAFTDYLNFELFLPYCFWVYCWFSNFFVEKTGSSCLKNCYMEKLLMLKILHGCILLHFGLGYQLLERILLLKVLHSSLRALFRIYLPFWFVLLSIKWSSTIGHLCPFDSEPPGGAANQILAPYSIFKGKAALTVKPVLPTFTKLDVWVIYFVAFTIIQVHLFLWSWIMFLLIYLFPVT